MRISDCSSDVCSADLNPRREAPLINARLRKRYLQGGFKVGVIGPQSDLTYCAEVLGAGPETLAEIADGRHPFAEVLKQAKRPIDRKTSCRERVCPYG